MDASFLIRKTVSINKIASLSTPGEAEPLKTFFYYTSEKR